MKCGPCTGWSPKAAPASYEAWLESIEPEDRALAERAVQEAAGNGTELIISWNKALEMYSSIGAGEVIGTDQQWRTFYPERRPVLADLLVDGNIDGLFKWSAGKLQTSRYVKGAYEALDFFPHMGESGKWLSFTAATIRDERGEILGAVETLEDVTERVNAEKAVRESEGNTGTLWKIRSISSLPWTIKVS